MPLILVVEQEKRYVERIEQALGPQGWEVLGFADRAGAMQKAAHTEVALLVVNAEVDDAAQLVESFGRASGGPGAVVLVPENSGEEAAGIGADEVLNKPFTDQDISLAVRRCVSAAQLGSAEANSDEGVQLTSEDIFGDVVLELENAFSLAASDGAQSLEQAPSGVVPEEDATEEPVATVSDLEPVAEERKAEEEEEEAVEPEATFEETAEAEIDQALDSLEEVGDGPVSESVSEGEGVDTSESEDDPEEDGPEVEEVAEDTEVEVEEEEDEIAEPVTEQDAEDLDERESTSAPLSAEPEAEETVTPTPSTLDQALGSLLAEAVEIDDEFARPAEVTAAEIDAMVQSVVLGPGRPASAPASPSAPPPAASEGEEVVPEFYAAAPIEGLEEYDEGGDGEPVVAASSKRPNMMVWAIILLALAALVIFVLSSFAEGEQEGPAEIPTVTGRVSTESVESPADATAAAPSSDDTQESENNGDGE